MPLRPAPLTTQATQLLLARRWEASLREAFDYRQLFDALLPQEALEVTEARVTPGAAPAPAFDPVASARWLDDFRQMVQQRHSSFAIEEPARRHVLEPWSLAAVAGSLPAPGVAIAEEDDLIRQWRLAQAEASRSRRSKTLQPLRSREALSAYAGNSLLVTSQPEH